MNRRGLIKAILGTGAAAAAGVSPKDILAAAPAGSGAAISANMIGGPLEADSEYDPALAAMRHKAGKLQSHLRERRERLAYQPPTMPPHIQSMKSWSPVYKNAQWQRQINELQAAIDALDDPKLGAKLFDLLMGDIE